MQASTTSTLGLRANWALPLSVDLAPRLGRWLEYAIGAAIAAHRDFLGLHAAMTRGGLDWNDRFVSRVGFDLGGSTLGLVGLGNIGRGLRG